MVDHGAALGNMSLHSTFGKKIREAILVTER